MAVSKKEATTSTPRKGKRQKTDTPVDIVDLEGYDDGGRLFFPAIPDKGTVDKLPIIVEQYSESRELRRAIEASLKLNHKNGKFIDLSDNDDVIVLDRKNTFSNYSVTEKGESSNSLNDDKIDHNPADNDISFTCAICIESKPLNESFRGCSHSYCTECISKYVASKLEDGIINIPCPVTDCKGVLEPEYCRHILSQELFNRWGHALCEGMILESQKFYCPYKDCSALLINDGGNVVRESECPYCRRLFCAQCKVPWHADIGCAVFQELNKDEREREDLMLMKLAQEKRWMRCPACKFYVEKIKGCLYITCRCGTVFCYGCGAICRNFRPTCKRYCLLGAVRSMVGQEYPK